MHWGNVGHNLYMVLGICRKSGLILRVYDRSKFTGIKRLLPSRPRTSQDGLMVFNSITRGKNLNVS